MVNKDSCYEAEFIGEDKVTDQMVEEKINELEEIQHLAWCT